MRTIRPNPIANKKNKKLGHANPFLFLAPFLIILVVFQLAPVLFTLALSFARWDGISPMTFTGLANYERLFKDSRFYLTIFNTFLIMLLSMPVNIAFALLISHIMNSKLIRFKRFFQLSNFLPYITTPVAIGLIWAILFDWKYGTINRILTGMGLIPEPVNWLGGPMFARVVLALIVIWKNYGYLSVLFLAGISAISNEIYEAAIVDGANSRQTFFRITIPLLKPVLIFVTVTGIIGGLQLFDEPFLLFQGGLTGPQPYGGPKLACLTMVMNFYDAAFQYFDMGYGAAIAYGMFLIIAVFSFTSLKLMTRGDD